MVMKVYFEGEFDFTNLPNNEDREDCIKGAIAKAALENPEDFLENLWSHDIIIKEERKTVPRTEPVEGHFGFYTGR
jgi:hypothetical protein